MSLDEALVRIEVAKETPGVNFSILKEDLREYIIPVNNVLGKTTAGDKTSLELNAKKVKALSPSPFM
jgi:hypothetical protein